MKGLMMQIISQEQHYFGLQQYTWISILLYLSHLLQDKTLYLPKYWGRYIPEQTVHTQIRSSLIMVYTVWRLMHVCINETCWSLFQTIMSTIFGVQIFMNFQMKCPVQLWKTINKNIRNNIILKTEQNSSQAHHIKRQNQNIEDKHCRIRWGVLLWACHTWIWRVCRISYCFIQCLNGYLCNNLYQEKNYLLNLRGQYYVCACKYYKYLQPVQLLNLVFVLNFHCILSSTQMYSWVLF